MSRSQLLAIAGSAIAVAAGAAAWGWAQERATLTSDEIARRGRQTELERDVLRSDARVARALAETEKARAAFASGTGGASEAPVAAPTVGMMAGVQKYIAERAQEQERPQEQLLFLRVQPASLRRLNAPFFRTRGIDAQKEEAFIAVSLKRDEQLMDLEAAARASGFSSEDPAIAKRRDEIYAQTHAAQRAILGEAEYAALLDYERTIFPRVEVGNFAGLAAVRGVALTPGQSEAMLKMIVEASSAYRAGGRASDATIDWDRLRAQLPTVLSKEQVDLFDQRVARQQGWFDASWIAVLKRAMGADAANAASGGAKVGATAAGDGSNR